MQHALLAYASHSLSIYKLFRVIVLLFLTGHLSGQANVSDSYDFVPKSPEASRLIVDVETPVSAYTGTAAISIPLWGTSDLGLSSTVTADYRTGGVKVSQIASAIGLGWQLNSHPMITRKVNGLPDELTPSPDNLDLQGFLHFRTRYTAEAVRTFTFDHGDPYRSENQLYDKLAYGCWDSQPDEYFFNIGEASGTFMYDWVGEQPVVICESDVKVINVNGLATEWQIISGTGNSYHFSLADIERTQLHPSPDATPLDLFTCAGQPAAQNYISAWHCSSATDVNSKLLVDYEYQDYGYQTWFDLHTTNVQQTAGYTERHEGAANCPATIAPTNQQSVGSSMELLGKKIQRITYSTGAYVNFTYQAVARNDVAGLRSLNNFTALDEIEVGRRNHVSKRFSFKYLSGTGRLFLEKITPIGSERSTLPPYTFTYDRPNQFPASIQHKGVDFWGYYNQADNSHLVSTFIANILHGGHRRIAGADRTPNLSASKIGALKRVDFPLGKTIAFDYELNEYGAVMSQPLEELMERVATPRVLGVSAWSEDGRPARDEIEFEVPETTFATLSIRGPATGNCFPPRPPTVTIIDAATNNSVTTLELPSQEGVPGQGGTSVAAEYTFELPAGGYRAVVEVQSCLFGDDAGGHEIAATIEYLEIENIIVSSKLTGGLRLTNITTYEPTSAKTVSNIYQYTDEDDRPSGVVYSQGEYTYTEQALLWSDASSSNGGRSVIATCEVTKRVGTSRFLLSQTKGSHIGYRQVRIITQDGAGATLGSRILAFSSAVDFPDIINTGLPFGSPQSNSHLTGYLVHERILDALGNPLTTAEYDYSNFTQTIERAKVAYSINLQRREQYYQLADLAQLYSTDIYARWFAPYSGGYRRVSKATTTQHYGDQTISRVEDFTYDDKLRKQSSRTVNAGESTTETEHYRYAEDLNAQCLIERNMLAIPLEVVHVNSETEEVLRGRQTQYGYFRDGVPMLPTTACNESDPLLVRRVSSYRGGWIPEVEILAITADNRPHLLQRRSNKLRERYTYDDTRVTAHESIGINGEPTLSRQWTYWNDSKLLRTATAVDGQVTNYRYDDLERLWEVADRGGSRLNTFSYGYISEETNEGNYVRTETTWQPQHSRLSAFTEQATTQYFDGTGRDLQTVTQRGVNKLNRPSNYVDRVTQAVSYDELGRVIKQYVPFASNHTDGRYVPPTGQPVSTITYLDATTNRINTMTPPEWEPTSYSYGTNTAEIRSPGGEVRYSVNSLYTNTTVDADGLRTTTYTDKRERVVLVRQFTPNEREPFTDTYTRYDDNDRIVAIYPPGASESTPELIYAYTYYPNGNLRTKKVPGRIVEEYFYNNRDQLTYTKLSSLPTGVTYLATQYDDHGRVVKTGFTNSKPASNECTPTTIPDPWRLTETQYGTATDGRFYRDKVLQSKVWVLQEEYPDPDLVITTNYKYDDYGQVSSTNANTLLNDNNNADVYVYLYDGLGTVLQTKHTVQTKSSQTTSISSTYLDQAGRPNKTTHQLNHNNRYGRPVTIATYGYDEQNRIIQEGLGGSVGVPLQTVNYNFLSNGFLSKINNPSKPGDDLFALQLHYRDAPNGGTPRSNGNISALTHYAPGTGNFTQTFTYDDLNRLKTATDNHLSDGSTSGYQSSYNYDQRGNLTHLTRRGMTGPKAYATIDDLTFNYSPNTPSNQFESITEEAAPSFAPDFKTGYEEVGSKGQPYRYDASGNMTKDPARGFDIAYNYLNLPYAFTGRQYVYLDYSATGQKLKETTVKDQTNIEQRYYLGDMEFLNEELVLVHHGYGRLLPQALKAFEKTDNCDELVIEEVEQFPKDEVSPYAGKYNNFLPKKRTVYEGKSTTTTAKVPQTNAVAFTGKGLVKLEAGFASPAGSNLLVATKDCPTEVVWQYEYYLKDHLGNMRVRFADLDLDGEVVGAEVFGEHHYYAFGLEMRGAWNDDSQNQSTTDDNRYRYNGKELNTELGLYDYGARWYDPAIARWTGIDALAEKFASYSPYNYVLNNPIMFIDPDGNDVIAPNEASKQLVMNSVAYMFGKDHGFAFDGDRLYAGNKPRGLSEGQEAMYDLFVHGVVNSCMKTTVRANERSAALVRGDNVSILIVKPSAAATTFNSNQLTLSMGEDGSEKFTFAAENIMLVPSSTVENGANVMTKKGLRKVGADHITTHEFGHSIVNTIMSEFGGKFEGINFNDMTKEERSDWAIRFTNTLFGVKSGKAETGEGQHGRDDDTRPSSSLAPINN